MCVPEEAYVVAVFVLYVATDIYIYIIIEEKKGRQMLILNKYPRGIVLHV